MESLPPSVINRKWLLCAVACFLGYLLLSFSLGRVSLPTATIASLHLESIKYYSMDSPAPAPAPAPAYASAPADLAGDLVPAAAPQSVAAATSSAPSNLVLVMNSSSSSVAGFQTLGPSSAPEAKTTVAEKKKCDVFDGRWVYDRQRYPLYRAHRCPFLSDQVSCQKNGRPDSEYEHWRWQPNGCDLPSLNGSEMLERLRGKRVVMVGDSLNRNMWESLACILYSAVRPTRAVVQAHASGHKLFRALDYECRVEFYWSPFLVELKEREGDHAKILRLDKLPPDARRWLPADVVVFNTGHWWTHQGKMRAWNYFERKDELVEEMEIGTAFNRALETWAHWVDNRVDPRKTAVFFRSISPEHKSMNWCYNQTYPITTEPYLQMFPSSLVHLVKRTINKMTTPMIYLNITQLSEYRRDGHTTVYTSRQGKLLTIEQRMKPLIYADCSHWCLPGVPDTWNVLLFASIMQTTASHPFVTL